MATNLRGLLCKSQVYDEFILSRNVRSCHFHFKWGCSSRQLEVDFVVSPFFLLLCGLSPVGVQSDIRHYKHFILIQSFNLIHTDEIKVLTARHYVDLCPFYCNLNSCHPLAQQQNRRIICRRRRNQVENWFLAEPNNRANHSIDRHFTLASGEKPLEKVLLTSADRSHFASCRIVALLDPVYYCTMQYQPEGQTSVVTAQPLCCMKRAKIGRLYLAWRMKKS